MARVVNQAEIDRTPAAKQAMDKEWQKLVDKSCWLHSKVREFRDVSAEAIRKGVKTPDRKWKGRSVFQGNRVSDEHNDHALFSELGSSPASLEAAKVIDVLGSQPGYSKQQADAKQAYTQALFKGVETWVRLPRNRWPKEWQGFQDPVVPLMLALYGHPDSGGIWEKHCEDQLKTVGWTPVNPEIRQSIFYHAELDLLLVIYVDDFKMAGPSKNLDKGWKTIESVIDMDPPEPFGRYFGCNHFEKHRSGCHGQHILLHMCLTRKPLLQPGVSRGHRSVKTTGKSTPNWERLFVTMCILGKGCIPLLTVTLSCSQTSQQPESPR